MKLALLARGVSTVIQDRLITNPERLGTKEELERFHQIARQIKLPDESGISTTWGENASIALKKLGWRTNRKIAAFFADLSDEDLTYACTYLTKYVVMERGGLLWERIIFHLLRNSFALYNAKLFTLITPTVAHVHFHRRTPFNAVGIFTGGSSSTPLRFKWINEFPRVFPDAFIDEMHGWLLNESAKLKDHYGPHKIDPSNITWFGQNRERIVPLWAVITEQEAFDPERVEVLLASADHGSISLLDGAL